MATHVLHPQPLTRAAFAPYGDVIETAGAHHYSINEGSTRRFHDLCKVDVSEQGGHCLVNLFRATPLPCPIPLRMLERHPLGSQAFMPLGEARFLIVVAQPTNTPRADDLRAFLSNGKQGVNYARNTWHHFVLALDAVTDFLVVDRGGPGENCEEITLADKVSLLPD